MDEVKIIRGEFDTKLELHDATVVAGFPSPAENYDLGTYYNDFINECEKLGDYVVNVVQARFGV